MAESALIQLHSLVGNFGVIVRVEKMDAELARDKAALRDVVHRTNSDLMGVCTPILHLEDAVIVL